MKIRLDKLLVEKQLAATRQKAQALIIAGLVQVGAHRSDKPGNMVDIDSPITITGQDCPFVSRGGFKLAKGLDYFSINPHSLVCADIGASTGGFTDCLLQNGAQKVYAVDVGYGQLDWKLRQDARVIVKERTNARHLTPADFDEPIDLAVIDAAFISLKILIPPLLPLFETDIAILALIKPQFEVGKGKIGKGGVVKDPDLHTQVTNDILNFSAGLNLTAVGITESPILGPKGNKEFLIYLRGKR
jgi:23S rRNA (cytidine1920-2'-O)/16S rRNA (cytidine1409-2'-O)-methyltransferase